MGKEDDPGKTESPRVLLVVRCFINKGDEILVLHRNEERHYNPGKWELPGGKLKDWDDLERAIEKEALEETGFFVKIISPDAIAEGKLVKHSIYSGMLYLELAFKTNLVGGKIRLSSDHDDYQWLTPEDALDLDLSPESEKAIAAFIGRKTLKQS